MKAFRTHCRWPLVLAVMIALVANARALDWFDDFSGGDAEDGDPVMWTPFTDFLPGDYDASSGDYVLTPIDDGNTAEALVSSVNDVVFPGDIYAQTLAFVDSPSDVGNVGLIIRFDPLTVSGYIGVLDNGGNGVLTMSRIEFGVTAEQYPQVNLDPVTAATDVMIEFSAVGDQLSLTAWDPLQPKPDPQITQTDSVFSSGAAGIVFSEDNNNTAGVFRWVAAQDVPFVELADFDGDGDVDGADFLTWQRDFGMTSGAALADGDADGNGAVNGADLDVWKTDFGTTGSGLAVAAVPEPASALLVSLMVVALATVAARRRA